MTTPTTSHRAAAAPLRPAAGHGAEHDQHDRHRAVHHDPAADDRARRAAGACSAGSSRWSSSSATAWSGASSARRCRHRADRSATCARRSAARRFGRLMAFLFVWQFILSGPLEIASGYIGFAQYARLHLAAACRARTLFAVAAVGRRRQHRAALPPHRLDRDDHGHALGRHAADDARGDRHRRAALRPAASRSTSRRARSPSRSAS